MNGRTYRLRCGDGEEPRLLALAGHVGAKVEQLLAEFGQVGEDRLMLMAALLVCDELFDARDRLAAAGVTLLPASAGGDQASPEQPSITGRDSGTPAPESQQAPQPKLEAPRSADARPVLRAPARPRAGAV